MSLVMSLALAATPAAGLGEQCPAVLSSPAREEQQGAVHGELVALARAHDELLLSAGLLLDPQWAADRVEDRRRRAETDARETVVGARLDVLRLARALDARRDRTIHAEHDALVAGLGALEAGRAEAQRQLDDLVDEWDTRWETACERLEARVAERGVTGVDGSDEAGPAAGGASPAPERAPGDEEATVDAPKDIYEGTVTTESCRQWRDARSLLRGGTVDGFLRVTDEITDWPGQAERPKIRPWVEKVAAHENAIAKDRERAASYAPGGSVAGEVDDLTLALDVARQRADLDTARLTQIAALGSPGPLHDLGPAAADIATRYQAAIRYFLCDPFQLTEREWTGMFWRAGAAMLLAGETDLGWRQLRQAAAVRSPGAEVDAPPGVAAWLAQARAEVAEAGAGRLQLELDPGASALVDGRAAAPGGADVGEGYHLVTFYQPGFDEPFSAIVAVFSGDTVVRAWHPDASEPGSALALEDLAPAETAIAPSPPRWTATLAAGLASAYGTRGGGVRFGLVYPLGHAEVVLRVGSVRLLEPVWVKTGFVAAWSVPIDVGAGWRAGPVAVDGGLWADPNLAAGLWLGARVQSSRGRIRPLGGITGRFDLAPHAQAVPRGSIELDVGFAWTL